MLRKIWNSPTPVCQIDVKNETNDASSFFGTLSDCHDEESTYLLDIAVMVVHCGVRLFSAERTLNVKNHNRILNIAVQVSGVNRNAYYTTVETKASDVQASDIQATGLNGRHSDQCQGTFRPMLMTQATGLNVAGLNVTGLNVRDPTKLSASLVAGGANARLHLLSHNFFDTPA
ncbi:hypothetical protein DAPPUDRAFT_222703 [Daphnia pulex]|uniref:Uncharacterized protein n=1 Tax=Daphnia pulex TaxID=6669 RepID=E9G6R1_DAPPU|nr:hypothetical protein DAPPUDRAFT_222703 [Daphnia pulex]|eukprot:EFX84788.1 hypothetical protein DAPPUDRAFT_222703 [Daphnia pulex]